MMDLDGAVCHRPGTHPRIQSREYLASTSHSPMMVVPLTEVSKSRPLISR